MYIMDCSLRMNNIMIHIIINQLYTNGGGELHKLESVIDAAIVKLYPFPIPLNSYTLASYILAIS